MATNVSVLIKQSVLDKKYTKPSICICFPPGKYISLKKYMYICTAKNYIIFADSPTYVEYQQTL